MTTLRARLGAMTTLKKLGSLPSSKPSVDSPLSLDRLPIIPPWYGSPIPLPLLVSRVGSLEEEAHFGSDSQAGPVLKSSHADAFFDSLMFSSF